MNFAWTKGTIYSINNPSKDIQKTTWIHVFSWDSVSHIYYNIMWIKMSCEEKGKFCGNWIHRTPTFLAPSSQSTWSPPYTYLCLVSGPYHLRPSRPLHSISIRSHALTSALVLPLPDHPRDGLGLLPHNGPPPPSPALDHPRDGLPVP
jgi:hypothetical protein